MKRDRVLAIVNAHQAKLQDILNAVRSIEQRTAELTRYTNIRCSNRKNKNLTYK